MRRLKLMLTLIALLVATGVWAQGVIGGGRQKPVITDYPATFALDHGFYIYNMATDKYLSRGEAWGTQSCVVDFENDASGNKPFVYQFKNDVQASTTLPEGTYYLWSADVGKNKGWMARIDTDGRSGSTKTSFADGNDSHFSAFKTNWKVTDMGEGIYMITVPEDDPNGMYIEGCALGVDPDHYSAFTTPTYALYWDIETSNPGCQWMLFDAEAYNVAYEIYSVAPALLEAIRKAEVYGIDVTEAQAVYDDDNATLEEINAQIDTLNDLLIAYATPDDPVDVTDKYIVNATPTANADGWTITGRASFNSISNCAEYWNVSGASIKQTLVGLPAGSYKLSAMAFTRTNMEATLFANDNAVNLATVESSEVNNTSQANTWFNAGNGLNELFFELTEPADVEIGLTADTDNGDHWMVWRSFKLEYLGNHGGEIIVPDDSIVVDITKTILWMAVDAGYANAAVVETVAVDNNIMLTFDKGTNTNAPKYYTTGEAVRCYANNTFAVSSPTGAVISSIVIGFGSGEGNNEVTASVGTYEDGLWTGAANEVVFTVGGSTGHRRIANIMVTYSASGEFVVSVPTPKITPNGGKFYESQDVTLTCSDADAKIYYTLDGTDPTAESFEYMQPFTLTETTSVKAIAVLDAYVSEVATATFTLSERQLINVAEALAITDSLADGKTTDEEYLVKGYIVSMTEISSQYGNATFTIADEMGGENVLTVYRTLGFNGEKIQDENLLKVNDLVTIQGQLQKYIGKNGLYTPELKNGQIVEIEDYQGDSIDVQLCTIMGTVMSIDGKALVGTKVIVRNEEGKVIATTTVNANGLYRVEDLAEGMYEVEITYPGYVSITMQLMAIAGEPVSQSIILVKESEIIIEGERQKPEIANYSVNIWETDHGYYIYNVGTDKFLSMGEAWGTQSCVVDFENDASGNKPFTYQIKNDVQESTTLPEGSYYFWSADVGKSKGWIARINTDGRSGNTSTCFSDGTAAHFSGLKANWVITDMGGGIFQITVPVDDPNGMYIEGCALGVNPEHYSNAASPTYALYWDIPAEEAGCQWMFFDAEAYNVANEIYAVAAPALLALIEQAQAHGVDVTEAQIVYNNVNATLDEINEQIAILKEMQSNFASAKEPADVTDKYIVNPAPYETTNGWNVTGRVALDPGNKNAEFWNVSGATLEQTISLPAGLYKLTAIAMSREGQHGYLSAGNYKVELAHAATSVVNNRSQANTWFNEGNGINELYFPMVEDGRITIALTADATTGDHWTIWRSFKLEYIGNDLENSYKDAIRMTIDENWADEFANVTYTQSYFDAVDAAIASIDDIATVEDAIAELANPAPAVAIQTLRDNVAAWDAFATWYDDIQQSFYATPIAEGLGAMGDYVGMYKEATDLDDWLYDVGATWNDYAMSMAPVDEEITTEMLIDNGTEWFDSLYKATVLDILAQEIVPHTDITASFIVNPDFYSDGGTLAGWTVLNGRYGNNGRSYSNPVWYNNFHRVMEKWNGDFNFYQDIVLPKTGVYRVSTWGFYRPSDNQTMGAANSAWAVWNAANGKNEGANTVCAFFYADQLQKAFPNICNRTYTRAEIDAIGADYDDEIAISRTSRGGYANEYPYDFLLVEGSQDDGIFIPNGVYAADYVFTHDPYQESYKIEFAFVGQEKQPLRLGIKAENVGVPAGDIGWTLFDQLQLIYEGADADILEEPLAALIDQAVALLDKSNSREIRKVLGAAIENGQNAIAVQDGDAMLAAYNQLNDAIAFATENMDNYEILIAAQDKLNEAIQTYGAKTFDATLAEATVLQRDIEAMLADGTDNLENILNKIDEVDSMVVKLMIPDFDKQAYPYDLTFAIKNPKFTEDLVNGRVPGWNYNEDADYAPLSVANGIAEGYVNAKKGFDIWQTISGLPDGRKLPAGIYEVHAQGIGRWSNNESNVEMGFASIDPSIRAEAYEQLKDQMPVMYANDVEGFIANPYELPESEDEKDLMAEDLGIDGWYTLTFDGIYDVNTGELREFFIPNNRSTLAERFAHGRYNEDGEIDAELTQKSPWYDNVLICNVGEDGALTLGWKLNNAASNAWAPMTNFRIFYIGPDEGYVPQYFAELAQAVAELQEMIDQEKGEEDVREAAAAYIAEINPGIENQTWTRDEAKVILARINEYKNQLSIISLAIHVDVPGTLGEIVLAEAGEYSNVKNIKVSGSLNEYDMECFREMSNIVTVDLFETDVTRIESDYFYRHESLTKAVLPKNLEYMGWGVFYDCYNLTNIVCPVAEPAFVDGEIMGGNEYQCTLTVPSISVAFYQKASYWSRFRIAGSNILPEDINVSHGTYTLNLPETIPATYKPNVWLGTTTIWGEHRYGGLEVNGNSTLSMNNFAITYDPNIDRQYNSGWYERPNHQTVTYGTLVNNANLRADNVTVQMWTKTNEWTFFSVPFDVKVSSIRKEFGETPYVIRKYDGVKRAASDMDNTWVDMTADSTLVAGQGYILQSPSYNGRYYDGFSFDAIQNTNKNNIFANDNVDVQLAEYVSEFPQNRSWNLIGNPYPCFFDTRAIDVTAPVIVWNAYNSNYEAYSPVDDQLILKPGEAFFMQRPVDQASITFLKEGRQNNLVIRDVNYFGHARQSDMKEERNVFNLTLSDGERGDHTRFVINNSAKMSYEEGCDASKFMSLDWKANQLYTIQSGVRYAINERPMDNGVIELGLMIGTEGMLTIALETEVQNEVFLIDRQNGTETRIDGTSGYEFYAEQGTIEGRFAIRLGDGNVTGIMAVYGSDKDNHEYYDLRGVRIQQPRKGLYIQNGKKVVIK